MSERYVWVIEAKMVYPAESGWHPVLNQSTFKTRGEAREKARQFNRHRSDAVRYRATKYVRRLENG